MLDLNKVKQIIFDDICILLDDLEFFFDLGFFDAEDFTEETCLRSGNASFLKNQA